MHAMTRGDLMTQSGKPEMAVTAEGEAYPSGGLQFTDIAAPEFGGAVALASPVYWCRIPLPIDLNHINVWLLDCGDGYVLVDTGMGAQVCMDAWEKLGAIMFAAKPLRAIFTTHIHPDHLGLAAWLQERYRVPVLMSKRTFEQAEMLLRGAHRVSNEAAESFFRANGLPDTTSLRSLFSPQRFAKMASGMPEVLRHVEDGEVLEWGGQWTALETNGHAEGHLCLSNATQRLLISGDQVLPTISSNISFTAASQDPNPLDSFLTSLQRLRALDPATLVLPSHGVPFRGLQYRVDDLLNHHAAKLDAIVVACAEPKSAFDILPVMFRRTLIGVHLFLALAEALAHLEYLALAGRLQRKTGNDEVVRYAEY
jgi:glyoxylase-like metal-dependent hydrolase (beta-lactamase superfamily II)